jgi:hypothetical protein
MAYSYAPMALDFSESSSLLRKSLSCLPAEAFRAGGSKAEGRDKREIYPVSAQLGGQIEIYTIQFLTKTVMRKELNKG